MTFAFVAAFAAATPATALAQTGLTGESFEGTYVITQPCAFDPDTNTYTFTYQAEGAAAGPYPGTYTEQGVVRFASTGVDIAVVGIQATFKIYVLGTQPTVEGTKSSLDPAVPLAGIGTCTLDGLASLTFAVVSYTANITDPVTNVTTQDHGAASFGLVIGVHNEFFLSLGTTQAVRPGLGCGDKNHVHEREEVCKKVR